MTCSWASALLVQAHQTLLAIFCFSVEAPCGHSSSLNSQFHLTPKCHCKAHLLLHTLPSSSASLASSGSTTASSPLCDLSPRTHYLTVFLFITFIFSISLFPGLKLPPPQTLLSQFHLAVFCFTSITILPFPWVTLLCTHYPSSWIHDLPLTKHSWSSTKETCFYPSLYKHPHLLTLCFYFPYSFCFLPSLLPLLSHHCRSPNDPIFHTIAFET